VAVAVAALVKLGGDVLEGPALGAVARDLAGVVAAGHVIVVVHGGGPQSTALSRRLGIEPRIVGGRRITGPDDLDIVTMVVAGRLNVALVAALGAAGVSALGLHGASGRVIRAQRRPPRVVSGAGPDPVDFGLVGDVESFDTALLDWMLAAGHVPVLACLGCADDGTMLNINADIVASRLASALGAGALVAVSGVGGVRRDKDDPKTRIGRLTVAEARAAIADGSVVGGMIPKLEEAMGPLAAGVATAHIVGPGEIAAALAAPGSVGTVLLP
jgi:acetylglutamate kinase